MVAAANVAACVIGCPAHKQTDNNTIPDPPALLLHYFFLSAGHACSSQRGGLRDRSFGSQTYRQQHHTQPTCPPAAFPATFICRPRLQQPMWLPA
jgi:hypothetical protein